MGEPHVDKPESKIWSCWKPKHWKIEEKTLKTEA